MPRISHLQGYDMNDDVRLARRGTPRSDPPGSWDEHANAPLLGLSDGIAQYQRLHVDPSQLVIALPWYGYRFTCANNSRGAFCEIQGDQVHGCPRSACPQISFGQIESLRTNRTAVGPVRWDNSTTSVFFDWFNGSGVRHQVWYDNAETLAIKCAWAGRARLRGVGTFLATMLECTGSGPCAEVRRDPAMNGSSAAMWAAFDSFKP